MAESDNPRLSYGVLLYPGFEVLDVAGPIECLNTLTDQLPNSKLTLAVIGRPIDENNPHTPADLSPANPRSGPPFTSNPTDGFSFQSSQVYKPSHTFETAPPLDVLIIGGGWGSFPLEAIQPEIDFLKKVFPSLQNLFTVCTGSAIAAKAGLLDGLRATSNKANWQLVTPCGPRTHWVAQARWVTSGKIWTSSGVSAGIDGMMAFIRQAYPEAQYPGLLERIANNMEYRYEPDPSNDPFARIFDVKDVLPQK
ncbi:hypothetical protein FVEN_g5680 [Fusarium venenatum]|uniref:DJ-1/PfpI domain-containing protein n=1 Tax=Fusarium venenatum TaxID=56646 RepID=A0A2L2TCB6_9HYPO|nr:uncharacterized protein FVRRES_04101 [Fusarium venenatum]KAG8356512.1 hypothetical protein FVEN_g5680 [Fusarium venenatum]CEI67589.1 unnamed protein product [Fusarium venenatum]